MRPVPADPGAHYHAALVRFARQLAAAGPEPARSTADPATAAAAAMALVVYPGPVGELVHREIHAYLEIGHRFGTDALVHRLVAHLSPPQKEFTDV